MSASPELDRALIVEDHTAVAQTLRRVTLEYAAQVAVASSVAEANVALRSWQPQLIVLDLVLPDGTGFDVLDQASACGITPRILAVSGHASPSQTFELAQRGVHDFIAKPFGLDELRTSLAEILDPPDLEPVLRQTVGQRGLFEVEADVRRVMVTEALERSEGSVRRAARLLGISRQSLQYILRHQLT